MAVEGIPPGGFRTVSQITGTNKLMFRGHQSGLEVATELLSSHMSGAPVIDEDDKLIGFISEFDILRILRQGRDLPRTTAQEIITRHDLLRAWIGLGPAVEEHV
jgi:CBS domain-containing protein